MTKLAVKRTDRVIYGVRNVKRNYIVRDHFESLQEAQSFVQEWLEDGGLDVLEVVQRTEIILLTDWFTALDTAPVTS